MFETFVVQPIFNLLAFILALIPGHNFGVAIIIFTIIVRLLMWPVVKKQLHQTRAMRKLQPEIKKIKVEAKGDRQKESAMLMELYKERGINPFASLVPLLIQLPIFIGLYLGLQKVVKNPQELIDFSYQLINNIPYMKDLAANIGRFDETLLGIVNLAQPAIGPKGLYAPALIIVIASAVVQYFQASQLMPKDADARGLRAILKDAGEGKQTDQSEVNAAIGRSTKFLLPGLVLLFTVGIPSALSLYWLTSGLVAFIQQKKVLDIDEEEMEDIADKKTRGDGKARAVSISNIPEAEIVSKETSSQTQKPKKKSAQKRNKRKK
jgi:YidC/Oxa1 family membrane protein insertase